MEKDWIMVYTMKKEYNADILKEILEDNNINCVMINKNDSSYIPIGDIEVYVHKDNEERAKELIKEYES